MPRAQFIHVPYDGRVTVLLNVKGEYVQQGVDWHDATLSDHALGVLRSGGQLLRLPRDVVRQMRLWDRVEILQLGVTQGESPTVQIDSHIPRAGENVGSPHD